MESIQELTVRFKLFVNFHYYPNIEDFYRAKIYTNHCWCCAWSLFHVQYNFNKYI